MHIRQIYGMFMLLFVLPVHVLATDSIRTVQLDAVVVSESRKKIYNRNSAQHVEVANEEFLREHFTGNLVQALEHIPGVRSMDIGSGFSKPVIRGMGFNRISVIENGTKQEGQQWGADHGLEIDAFGVEGVVVRKGPASLLYGSDAMGGAIEIIHLPPPAENQVFGEGVALVKSVNGTLGGSLMLGLKKNAWFVKFRYSEQHFGDYKVPADTIVYLTQRLPLYGRKLRNTAGFERDAALYAEYRRKRYYANYTLSNAYQKAGFFPGAHGMPDAAALQDDGNSRNIDMPYSTVNHFKASTRQQYRWDKLQATWDAGFQYNHREELSLFHTHYGTQEKPEKDPDKELAFALKTVNSSLRFRYAQSPVWEYTAGWDFQYQQNDIAGYSFLLPRYNRFTTGLFLLANWRPDNDWLVSGGVRYDYGKINSDAYSDKYLENYLYENGYTEELVEKYRWRAYQVNRRFGNVSGSLGVVWQPAAEHQLKANIGRSFRLPGVNELASNGVHHGTFRHEQGDITLSPEQGWQLDVSYDYTGTALSVGLSPFVSWYSNYIYLRPTGEWSVLPHAGQIYRYTGAEALFAGGELSFSVRFPGHFSYSLTGEYIYTLNLDEHIPLSFSPPASMRNTLAWEVKWLRIYLEYQGIAPQNRVARNEEATPGANLFHAGAAINIPLGSTTAEITLAVHNLLNTKYYNHLSFYRKVEIPEPGRNFQVLIKIPFKSKLK